MMQHCRAMMQGDGAGMGGGGMTQGGAAAAGSGGMSQTDMNEMMAHCRAMMAQLNQGGIPTTR